MSVPTDGADLKRIEAPTLPRLDGVIWQDDGAGWCVVEYPNGDLLAWEFDLVVGEWVDPERYTEPRILRAWGAAERGRAIAAERLASDSAMALCAADDLVRKADKIAAAERALRKACDAYDSAPSVEAGRPISAAADALRALGIEP